MIWLLTTDPQLAAIIAAIAGAIAAIAQARAVTNERDLLIHQLADLRERVARLEAKQP